MGRISEFKRRQILEMYARGISQRETARNLSISLRGVQAALNRHKKGYGTVSIPQTGRPRVLSKREVTKLVIASKRSQKKRLLSYVRNVLWRIKSQSLLFNED